MQTTESDNATDTDSIGYLSRYPDTESVGSRTGTAGQTVASRYSSTRSPYRGSQRSIHFGTDEGPSHASFIAPLRADLGSSAHSPRDSVHVPAPPLSSDGRLSMQSSIGAHSFYAPALPISPRRGSRRVSSMFSRKSVSFKTPPRHSIASPRSVHSGMHGDGASAANRAHEYGGIIVTEESTDLDDCEANSEAKLLLILRKVQCPRSNTCIHTLARTQLNYSAKQSHSRFQFLCKLV